MSRAMERRLAELEAKIAPRRADRLAAAQRSTEDLIRTAIGHYLGKPQPDEQPWKAIARGIGYKDSKEMTLTLMENEQEFSKKVRQAERRLFAQFGVDLDGDQEGFEDALKRMEAGLPESSREELRERRRLDGCG